MRWRAVGLMTPFLAGQIDVGEFVYDASVPAMRASVYGLELGAVDLLITDQDTYIPGPHSAPTRCTALGRKLRVPPTQWLSSEAVCFGETPVANRLVQWWQSPRPDASATWHWFSTQDRLPWRSLFLARSPDPAMIGDYAMTNFAAFAPLSETDLPALRDMCAKRPEAARVKDLPDAPTARELMAIRNEAAEAGADTADQSADPGTQP